MHVQHVDHIIDRNSGHFHDEIGISLHTAVNTLTLKTLQIHPIISILWKVYVIWYRVCKESRVI